MARKKRTFADCDEMRDMGEKIILKFQGTFFGLVIPEKIRFARITSEQAKNSKDMCVEENGNDWLEKSYHQFLIASYAEAWDTWSEPRKQWEVFSHLLRLPLNIEEKKTMPDINDYSFILERLGLRWRELNDSGQDLPPLLGADMSIEEDVSDEASFPD